MKFSDDVNTEMNGAEEGYVQLESIRYFDDTDNIRKSLGVGEPSKAGSLICFVIS